MLHLLGYGGASLLSSRLLGGCSTGDSKNLVADGGVALPDAAPPDACDKAWWLCRGYAPVGETEATDLVVEGALPPSLRGTYLRNGANPTSGTSEHWFVGDGMVHGLRIEDSKASWYRNRYVQTEILTKPGEETTPLNMIRRHQANTSIVVHGGKALCLAEVGLPYEVSLPDLSTLGMHDYAGKLAGPMTAHPKLDPATGELHFFGYDVLKPTIAYHVADASGAIVRSESVALKRSVMMHDFQLTSSHALFYDLPVIFDINLALGGSALPFRWDEANGARIGLLPRGAAGSEVVWIDIDPCYIFHTFNAWNDPADANLVHLDAIRYPEMWVEGPGNFDTRGDVWRYTLDLAKKEAKAAQIDDTNAEFPRIDERFQGVPYRFGYGSARSAELEGGIAPADRVEKYDRQTGETSRYQLPAGHSIDEVTFVPDSEGAGEDEGWLVAFTYDATIDKSAFVVLDASAPDKGPVARVLLPQRVPHGFHGTWVPG